MSGVRLLDARPHEADRSHGLNRCGDQCNRDLGLRPTKTGLLEENGNADVRGGLAGTSDSGGRSLMCRED